MKMELQFTGMPKTDEKLKEIKFKNPHELSQFMQLAKEYKNRREGCLKDNDIDLGTLTLLEQITKRNSI
jgi:hypothetical protein